MLSIGTEKKTDKKDRKIIAREVRESPENVTSGRPRADTTLTQEEVDSFPKCDWELRNLKTEKSPLGLTR